MSIDEMANELAYKNYGNDYTMIEVCAIRAGILAGLQMAAEVANDAIVFPNRMNDVGDITARDIRQTILALKGGG